MHAGHVTCLHWLPLQVHHSLSKSEALRGDRVLVTGSSDGHIAFWKVETASHGTPEFSLCARIDEAGNLSPTHVAPNTGNQAVTPVTGLASDVSHDGELTRCLLASVASDGDINIWACDDLSSNVASWTRKQQLQVQGGVIQNCVAFGHVPGHAQWCEACAFVPVLCTTYRLHAFVRGLSTLVSPTPLPKQPD